MKILIDPSWITLVENLSDKDKADIFMCILDYPNREHDSGVWRYIKKQIDDMADKYHAKCERMQQNGLMRWAAKNTISDVIEDKEEDKEKEKNNKIKNKHNCINVSESSCVAGPVENSVENVENPVDNFLITETFSINGLCKMMPKLENFINTFPKIVIEKAQKSLIKKRRGQWLSIGQVLEWIAQEDAFYKQNQRNRL